MSNPIKAFFWMVGAMVSFSLMAVSGRELGGHLDTFEIMTYRSLIGFLIIFFIILFFKKFSEVNTIRLKLHFIRNIFHFAGQNLWFFAVVYIPLSQLFALEFSTPIWVAILAPLFIKERLTLTRLFVVLLGFIGILIVVRPDFMIVKPEIVAGAFCAIGFAITSITTKKLTSTDSILCILFWLTVMQLLFGIICSGFDGDFDYPRGKEIYWVIIIGICGLCAHFCITMALSLAPAIIVSPMEFLRLPLITMVGYFMYNENLDWYIFLGATIVLTANIINLQAEKSRKTN